MKFLDPAHPFYRPLWRRWLTVLLPAGWGCVELVFNSPGWAIVFLASGAWAFWVLIVSFPKD
jgi:hypothetical protein